MKKYFPIVLLLLAGNCSAGSVFTPDFTATTPQQAVAAVGGTVAQDAWQLLGGSVMYGEEYPIEVWGRGYTPHIQTDWENRQGLMQEIPRRDFPADWNIEPNYHGYWLMMHWHIVSGPQGTYTSMDQEMVNRDRLTKIQVYNEDFFLYQSSYTDPGRYRIVYGSNVRNIVPEPATWVFVIYLVAFLVIFVTRKKGKR